MKNASGQSYLFWSGFGGDLAEFVLLFAGLRAVVKLRKQRETHHQQMKDHIDYQFKKLRGIEEKIDA